MDRAVSTKPGIIVLFIIILSGCTGIVPTQSPNLTEKAVFRADPPQKHHKFASPSVIDAVTPKEKFSYRLGPGDILDIQVWNRPELSELGIVVGPDGIISLPRIGILYVQDKTARQVQQEMITKLAVLYETPEVNLTIRAFHNNKAFVLGRVSQPGVVNFPGEGTLLEALALAGGLPYHGKETFLTKCAIIRGRELVIWIDLQSLLNNGNMALNARIRNNDVIFIPEAEDETVFVMGQVAAPGAVQLKRGLNVVKAVLLAGGITPAANSKKVFILRRSENSGIIKKVDLKQILETGDFSQNYTLQPNDIIYVSPQGMHKFNYAMTQLLPSLRVLNLSANIGEKFGLMQELRQMIWGQEGFVGD